MISIKDTRTDKLHKINTDKKVSIYTCGPTVYDHAHIGNFRTFVQEDLLIRSIKFLGKSKNIFRVMNFTDVDDKTIKNANKFNKDLREYTDIYIKEFQKDYKSLNLLEADEYPRATDYIDEMIFMIQDILEKGYAYEKDGSIYFNISKLESYGQLVDLSNLDSFSDVEESDEVNAKADFVLWKAWDKERDKDIYWESPFGKGRPGWHIECSAMIKKIMGNSIDIHAGGVDNIFPHHENEIAQSCVCNGCDLAKTWFHVNHLVVNNEKMSKSKNNFYTVRELLNKGFSGEEIRLALLAAHYSTKLNFSINSLQNARSSHDRVYSMISRSRLGINDVENTDSADEIYEELDSFKSSINNDLDISGALRHLFNIVGIVNVSIDLENFSEDVFNALKESIIIIGQVLGFDGWIDELNQDIPEEVKDLLNKREIARFNKDWKSSDSIRSDIEDLGYRVVDIKQGQILRSSRN